MSQSYPWFKFTHKKNLLTNCLTGLYSNLNLPHCKFGLGRPVILDAQPRPYAVFLCVLHGYIVLMGYVGKPSGLPVLGTGRPTPHNPSPKFGRSGGGFLTHYLESNIMQNLNINPSVILPFAAILSFEVPTTELDSDITPSILFCAGFVATFDEAKAACYSFADHPALIATQARQCFKIGGVQ